MALRRDLIQPKAGVPSCTSSRIGTVAALSASVLRRWLRLLLCTGAVPEARHQIVAIVCVVALQPLGLKSSGLG